MAREAGARILIASTSEVYGDPAEHPQRESCWGHVNLIGPRACYDEGKRCAEALATSYARQYGVEVRIARIFNTYGPRMHENDGRVGQMKGQASLAVGRARKRGTLCSNEIGILNELRTSESSAPVWLEIAALSSRGRR